MDQPELVTPAAADVLSRRAAAVLERAQELGVVVLTPGDSYALNEMDKHDKNDLLEGLAMHKSGRFRLVHALAPYGILELVAGPDAEQLNELSDLEDYLDERCENVFLAPPGYQGERGYVALLIDYDETPAAVDLPPPG